MKSRSAPLVFEPTLKGENFMEDSYGSRKSSDASNCSNWYASHDHMPPGPKTLHVSGECEFPTPGYTVELNPAVPQGINPKIYILVKTVHKPKGPEPDVLTTVQVRYNEQTDTEYDQVQIEPDGVLIKVEHTQ
jgi:hypothetical protein